MRKALGAFLLIAMMYPEIVVAAPQSGKQTRACNALDRPCLLRELEQLAPQIETSNWRDETYVDLAKTFTYEGQPDKALLLIPQIQENEKKAAAIKAIGMAVATTKSYSKNQSNAVFAKLAEQAKEINHPPSQALARTSIAMSQAIMSDDEAARATASAITNAAIRNNAFGEIAVVDAERSDLKNAMLAVAQMDAQPYRNKVLEKISGIFLDKALLAEAYECAGKIDSPYLRAKIVQRILSKGNQEEASLEPRVDIRELNR